MKLHDGTICLFADEIITARELLLSLSKCAVQLKRRVFLLLINDFFVHLSA